MSEHFDNEFVPEDPALTFLPPPEMTAHTYLGMEASDAPLSDFRLDFAHGTLAVLKSMADPAEALSKEAHLVMEDITQYMLLRFCRAGLSKRPATGPLIRKGESVATYHDKSQSDLLYFGDLVKDDEGAHWRSQSEVSEYTPRDPVSAEDWELMDADRDALDRVTVTWIHNAVGQVLFAELLKHGRGEAYKALRKCRSEWDPTMSDASPPQQSASKTGGMGSLVFPVAVVGAIASQYIGHELTVAAAVYLTAILEYIVFEVLEVAQIESRRVGNPDLYARHITLGVQGDLELAMLFSSAIFIKGGVTPCMHKTLILPKQEWEASEHLDSLSPNLLNSLHTQAEFDDFATDYALAHSVTNGDVTALHEQGHFSQKVEDDKRIAVTTYQLTLIAARGGVLALSPSALQELRRLLQSTVCRHLSRAATIAKRRRGGDHKIVVTATDVSASADVHVFGSGTLRLTAQAALLSDSSPPRPTMWDAAAKDLTAAALQWPNSMWGLLPVQRLSQRGSISSMSVGSSPYLASLRQIRLVQKLTSPAIPFKCFAPLVAGAIAALDIECDVTPAAIRMLDEITEQCAVCLLDNAQRYAATKSAPKPSCVEGHDIVRAQYLHLKAIALQYWTHGSHREWSQRRRSWVVHFLMVQFRLRGTTLGLPIEMWLMILTFLRGRELGPMSAL